MKTTLIALALGFNFMASSPFGQARADDGINENPLTARAKFSPETTAPGATTELQIELELAPGHHAYVDRFKVAVDSPEGLLIDSLRLAPIVKFKDAVSGGLKDGVENKATLRATVEIPADFAKGAQNALIRLTYQACTVDHCLFPKTIELNAPFTIGVAKDGFKSIGATTANGAEPSDFQTALGRGTLSALAFMFVIGFLTSLTPCIYPMIPITLAVLGTRTEGQTRARGFALSFVYVLGIATAYSALGVAAASAGALFGAALSNVYVVTAVALIFVAMGLSMYGHFELQMPALIRARTGQIAAPRSSFYGAYLTGLLAGVVASPCVGPVLVGALAYIAQTGDRLFGFWLLFTFAMGMGVLFMALGSFSQLIKRLPRSGPWMEGVKFAFGTVMIGMALYYVQPLYPTWLFRAALGLALVLIASGYGAFAPNVGLSAGGRLRKGAMLAALIVGSAFIAAAALERSGARLMATAPPVARLNWLPYSDEALAQARAARQPVILDFSADWCAACKELERDTFSDPRVQGKAQTLALLTVDATRSTPAIAELLKRYGVLGLPTMIFIGADGAEKRELRLTGFEGADAFLRRLDAALKL